MVKSLALIVSFLFMSSVANAVNYLDLERKAAGLYCDKKPQHCIPFKEPTGPNLDAEVYKVNGRVMPPDAMRDDAKQLQMLPANLYVKKDGSVAQIYEVDIDSLKLSVSEKSTVLPFKNFDIPPSISGSAEKLIIKTGAKD